MKKDLKQKVRSTSQESSCERLLKFIDESPTPFHAVSKVKHLVSGKNSEELSETDEWKLERGTTYFVPRNDSSIAIFRLGNESPENSGFKIIGAHTDSPNLRLKPHPVYAKSGYIQLGVEIYGGVLLSTWTDRDLGLAGRVILKDSELKSALVSINKPLLRIPQLAIHLNRNVNDKGLVLNKQTHMSPILSLAGEKLNLEKVLKELLASELGCRARDILNWDLALFDIQKGTLAGKNDEFIFSGRLDNLASCHAAVEAFLESTSQDSSTQVLVFYDHEEVGSDSQQGAGSPFLSEVLERIQNNFSSSREDFIRAMARSFCISADMAHAVHPNFSDMHEPRHWPVINQGPVVKINAGQRYATDGLTSSKFERLCSKVGVSVQKFVMRSDLACGSTIGPITAANLGIRTVDIGNPMLSMHSIREMAGTKDHVDLIHVFKEFFKPPRLIKTSMDKTGGRKKK